MNSGPRFLLGSGGFLFDLVSQVKVLEFSRGLWPRTLWRQFGYHSRLVERLNQKSSHKPGTPTLAKATLNRFDHGGRIYGKNLSCY